MYAYKDLLELAGLTARVYTLISTLHALPPVREFIADDDEIALNGVSICVPERTVRGDKHDVLDDCDDHLGLGGADDSLVEPLRLVVKRGEHLMITGPVSASPGISVSYSLAMNCCIEWRWQDSNCTCPWRTVGSCRGTSSSPGAGCQWSLCCPTTRLYGCGYFARSVKCGEVRFPLADTDTNYFCLRRIIYPHTYTQFRAAGGTDQQLMEILERVHLEYLPTREGGWTTVKEWRDVFSGGERQRVCLRPVTLYSQPDSLWQRWVWRACSITSRPLQFWTVGSNVASNQRHAKEYLSSKNAPVQYRQMLKA